MFFPRCQELYIKVYGSWACSRIIFSHKINLRTYEKNNSWHIEIALDASLQFSICIIPRIIHSQDITAQFKMSLAIISLLDY